jgi:hypothetical protein
MPENTAIALLNSASQVSSDIYRRIDANLAQDTNAHLQDQKVVLEAAQLQEQQRQAFAKEFAVGAGLQLQESQFKADMAYKAATFAETQRMNTAQITNLEFDNKLKADQFRVQQMLTPLTLESARMKLQNDTYQFKLKKDEYDNKNFSDMVAIHDEVIGYDLLGTESIEQAQEYNSFKASWKDRVLKGEVYNNDEYKAGVDAIRDKYKDVKPTENGWTQQKSTMFHHISEPMGRQYDQTHPGQQRAATGIAVSMLTADEDQFSKDMSTYSYLYNPDAVGYIGAARTTVRANMARMAELDKEHGSVVRALNETSADNAPQREFNEGRLQDIQDEYNARKAQNKQISINVGKGNYQNADDPVKANLGGPKVNLEEYSKWKPQLGFQAQNDIADSEGERIAEDLSSIKANLGEFEDDGKRSVLKGITFDWFNDNRPTGTMDTKSMLTIKDKVAKNIQSVDNLSSKFKPESINKILDKIDGGLAVPMSKEAVSIINREYSGSLGSQVLGTESVFDTEQNTYRFNGDKEGMFSPGAIRTRADIDELLRGIKNIKDRRTVANDLYAALTTAALGSAVQSRQ